MMWPKGKPRSQETKDKMSKSTTGRKRGPMSEEQKAKLSAINTGKTLSQETKDKISKAGVGNKRSLGFKHSEETRKKWSEQRKGRSIRGHKVSEETKSRISAALKGRVFSEEHRAKISASNMGRTYKLKNPRSEEYRLKLSQSLRGKTKSIEHRKNLSIAKMGIKPSHETRAKLSAKLLGNTRTLGHTLTPEHRTKISQSLRGSNNPAWKGGRLTVNQQRIRNAAWERLARAVRHRDNHTCQHCDKTNCHLDVHHKIPHRLGGPDSMNNLVSLCKTCHGEIEQKFINVVEPHLNAMMLAAFQWPTDIM